MGTETHVKLAEVGGALWFVTFLRRHLGKELGLWGHLFMGAVSTFAPPCGGFLGPVGLLVGVALGK